MIIVLAPLLLLMITIPMIVMMGDMVNGMMTVSPILSLVTVLGGFFVLLAIGYALYHALRSAVKSTDPVIDRLRMPYAQGDITQEELEQRKHYLGESQ